MLTVYKFSHEPVKTDVQNTLNLMFMQAGCLRHMAKFLHYGDDITRASYLDIAVTSLANIRKLAKIDKTKQPKEYKVAVGFLRSLTRGILIYILQQ
ncbi:unnamed protein product [Trichobilharzia szidati]|nr:unnamed protein product [Trichobilharzia szidati]